MVGKKIEGDVDVAVKGEMMAGIVNFANQFNPLGIDSLQYRNRQRDGSSDRNNSS